ncbi:MAG: hypothetical protein EBT15_08255 [Betaproteobacteria bacterium]|nr:hypothetical protein [Betaproteobacteria bacterium]
MKVREYTVMLEAVERGICNGLHRYNKHRDIPVGEGSELVEDLIQAVMLEVGDYFIWEDLEDET